MLKINLSLLAEEDLEKIWYYSFNNWGEKKAKKYLSQVEKAFLKISENPHIGIDRNKTKEDFYSIRCNKHIIFYKFTSEEIRIHRILHEKMDLNKNL